MFGKYMNVKAQHLNLLSNCIMHYTVQCITPLHNHYTTQCIMQLYKEFTVQIIVVPTPVDKNARRKMTARYPF